MDLCNRCGGEFFEKQLDNDGLCEECRLVIKEGVLPLEESDALDELATLSN